MGFVYEIACRGTLLGEPIANIYHVWDGDEDNTIDSIADVYEDNLLVDLAANQQDDMVWNEIEVTPLDVGNTVNAIKRSISISGSGSDEPLTPGLHVWVKFVSDDNGFKSGGKMISGFSEANVGSGLLTSAMRTALQTVFNNYLADLATADLAACILRPSISTPGFPNISTVASCIVRGLATNNRRQLPFSA